MGGLVNLDSSSSTARVRSVSEYMSKFSISAYISSVDNLVIAES